MSKNLMRGFTLIEVVISVLIASMAVMASFSVILSSFVSGAKADKTHEGTTILRYASEKLKAYVSANPTEPGYALPGGGIWGDDASGLWALAPGPHDITTFLDKLDPGPPTRPTYTFPPLRSLIYTVTNKPCGAFTCKEVVFILSYTE